MMSSSPLMRLWIFTTAFSVALFKAGYVSGDVPRITPFTFQKNVSLEESIKTFCVGSGRHPLSFEWRKNGERIYDARNVNIQNHEEFSVLSIKKVDYDDSGNYTCVVKNLEGTASHSAELAIHAPPKWARAPVDISVGLEGRVILDCEVKGHPKPVITWTKIEDDGERHVIKTSGRYSTADNGSLLISDVRPEDAGTYECSASNGIGNGLTKMAALSVHVPAKFSTKFGKETVRWGETAILHCEAYGDNPITITWTKDRIPVTERDATKFEVFTSLTERSTVSEMHVQVSDREDNGIYVCIAKNAFGKDERAVKLVVLEVPGAPSEIRVEQTWSESASVRWTSPYGGNSPITSYVVQYWRDAAGAPHRLEEVSVPATQTFTMLKDLQPGTSYVIRVLAENEVGRGNPSESQQFLTKEAEPSAPPTDVTVESRGAGMLLVKWKAPPRDQWNGQLKGYYVGYRVSSGSESYSFRTVEFSKLNEEEYKLNNLQRSTEYAVIVQAFNGAGSGPASQDVIVKTSDTDPPPAPFLWVDFQSRSAIGLKWKHVGSPTSAPLPPPTPLEGTQSTQPATAPSIHYSLFYKDEYGPWTELSIPKSAEQSYTLSGLREGARYQMYLKASSEAGDSEPSDVLTVRTEGGALSDMSSNPVVEKGEELPIYLKMTVIIPLGSSLGIIFLVLIGACFYVRREEKRNKAGAAGGPDRHYSYGGSSTLPHPGSKRYMDIEKGGRPLLRGPGIPLPPQPPPEGYPLPYATMPLRFSNTVDTRRRAKEDPHSSALMLSRNGVFHQATMDRKRPIPAGLTIHETAEVHHYDMAA